MSRRTLNNAWVDIDLAHDAGHIVEIRNLSVSHSTGGGGIDASVSVPATVLVAENVVFTPGDVVRFFTQSSGHVAVTALGNRISTFNPASSADGISLDLRSTTATTTSATTPRPTPSAATRRGRTRWRWIRRTPRRRRRLPAAGQLPAARRRRHQPAGRPPRDRRRRAAARGRRHGRHRRVRVRLRRAADDDDHDRRHHDHDQHHGARRRHDDHDAPRPRLGLAKLLNAARARVTDAEPRAASGAALGAAAAQLVADVRTLRGS